jgi:Pyruvate/2-oxoacid:ferredoxin oxidoreductase delta subunit
MQTLRKIVNIDEEKCTGCALCVTACAESAIQVIDGKARLVSEIYCDGLGACLGECPEDAITIEERAAAEFDEEATKAHVDRLKEKEAVLAHGCPGSMAREIRRQPAPADPIQPSVTPSQLANWPVQLKLVSPTAPYFQDSDLLLVADCVPFALADFHSRFLRGRPVTIGCPKLDDAGYYIEKLTEILQHSSINSLTVVHMEVPCCSGLTYIASRAIESSGKDIPMSDVTITIQGEVMADAVSSLRSRIGLQS